MEKKNNDSTRFHELRKRAEALLKISDEDLPKMSPDEIQNLVHSFRTYQIEMELQNEELRCAEEELLASREKYSNLYDFAPVGYITVSDKGMILESNLTFANMLGVERSRLINQPLSAYITDEDQDVYYHCRRKSLETKEQQTCELRIKLKENLSVWVRIDFKVIKSPEGGANQFYMMISNIAELKKNQNELTQSIKDVTLQKTEISALLESAQAALECQTFEEAAREIFDACRKATGAVSGCVALLSEDGSENEILFLEEGGLPYYVDTELPMPIRGLREEAYHKKIAVYENDFWNNQWMEYMPEGHVPLENVLFAPLIHNDRAIGLIGIANKPGGFTDNDAILAMAFAQQAAIALRSFRMIDEIIERDRILNQTGKMARIGGWEHDLKKGKGIWTEALYDIIEIEPKTEPPGPQEHLNYYPPEHRKTLEEAYQRSVEDGTPFDLELQVYTEKKNLIWCRVYGEPVFHRGECVSMRGTLQDITDHKQASIALEESEQRYRELFNHMSDGVAVYQAIENAEDFIFKNINESGAKIGKIKSDEVIGCRVTNVFPGIKDMGLFEVFHQVYRSGKPMHYPVSLYKDNRVSHWVENYVYKLSSGEIVAIYKDVTNRKQAEENLQSQTAFLESLLSSIPSPIFYKDNEGRYLGCNPAFEEISGEKLPNIIGKKVFDIWKKEYSGIYYDKDIELIQHPGVQQYESKFESPDGIVRDVIFHKSTFFDQRDEVAGIIGVMTDITERKKAEEALRESERMYRSAIEVAGAVPYYQNYNENIYEYIGSGIEQMTGYSPEEFTCEIWISIEKQICLLGDLQGLSTEEAVDKARQEEGVSWKADYLIKTRAGEERWLSNAAIQIRDEHGVAIGSLGILQDITERKQTEEALRKSEEKLRAVLDASPFPVSIVDLEDNNIIYWSRSAYKLFGHTAPTASEWYQIAYPDIDYRNQVIERWKPFVATALQTRKAVNAGEYRVTCSDSSERICELHISSLADCLIVTFNDITKRKQIEKKLVESQKIESIGHLAGGVAHEFNNLVMGVNGFCSLALEQLSSSNPVYQDIEEIKKSGDRMAGITRQLLAFGRKQMMRLEVSNLNTICSNIIKMIRSLIGENIRIITKFDPNLWFVKVDEMQIHQVLMNLAINARDAMPNGGILTLETGNKDVGENHHEIVDVPAGQYVRLKVSDTGCGMNEEIQAQIFEPFFTTKDVGNGTGLGLSTVHGIIAQCKGYINVASQPGKGTTFYILLPRVTETVSQSKSLKTDKDISRGTETILLVEDNKIVLEITSRIFRSMGYTVLEARNGLEALQLAKRYEEPIHILLTDIVMPSMGGFELAQKLQPLHPEMKITYMSGYPKEKFVDDNIILDPDINYIEKPISPDILAQRIRAILDTP